MENEKIEEEKKEAVEWFESDIKEEKPAELREELLEVDQKLLEEFPELKEAEVKIGDRLPGTVLDDIVVAVRAKQVEAPRQQASQP